MAQNWVVTWQKRLFLRTVDALLWPVSLVGRARRRPQSRAFRKILVLEFWHLGDAVLAEPFLRTLRQRFPASEIVLLCKPGTRTLLEPSGLVDRFILADIPWTAFSAKYSIKRYRSADFSGLVRRLRAERFDLTLDARMDVRSNVLTWLIGARRRIGFDSPGGRSLLTDRISPPTAASHKVSDWLGLLGPLGGVPEASPARLRPSDNASRSVGGQLDALGADRNRILVAVHPSARLAVRRWPLERFREIVNALAARDDVQVIVVQDPDGYGAELAEVPGVLTIRPGLDELVAYLNCCDLFIGNDSGPAHIAAAVGAPTVAIFGSAVSAWYRPLGLDHRVIQIDDMSCRPCFDHCTRSENFCITGISVQTVRNAVEESIGRVLARRSFAVDLNSVASDIPA